MDGEALLGDGRGGDEEDRPRAEPKAEETNAVAATAVAGSERGEGAVQRLLEEVEVADDGEGGRAWDTLEMAMSIKVQIGRASCRERVSTVV